MEPFILVALVSLAVATIVGERESPVGPLEFDLTDRDVITKIYEGGNLFEGGWSLRDAARFDPRRIMGHIDQTLDQAMQGILQSQDDAKVLRMAMHLEAYNWIRDRNKGRLPLTGLMDYQISIWGQFLDVQLPAWSGQTKAHFREHFDEVDRAFERAAKLANQTARAVGPGVHADQWHQVARNLEAMDAAFANGLFPQRIPWGQRRELPGEEEHG